MIARGSQVSYNSPLTFRTTRYDLYSRAGPLKPLHGSKFGINGIKKPHLHQFCSFRCRNSERDDKSPSISVPDDRAVVTGNLLLLIVSVLWGSYTPALRAIFTVEGAPSPLLVAAARGVMQASLLGVAVAIGSIVSRAAQEGQRSAVEVKDTHTPSWLSPVILGSLEIGAYNTFGTILQTWGLSTSSATRAAFLVQATALWTPMLSAAFGMFPSRILWISSFVALASTVFVTMDSPSKGVGGGLEALAFDMSSGKNCLLDLKRPE